MLKIHKRPPSKRAHVCKVTFKHLLHLLRSHMQSFRTLRLLLFAPTQLWWNPNFIFTLGRMQSFPVDISRQNVRLLLLLHPIFLVVVEQVLQPNLVAHDRLQTINAIVVSFIPVSFETKSLYFCDRGATAKFQNLFYRLLGEK